MIVDVTVSDNNAVDFVRPLSDSIDGGFVLWFAAFTAWRMAANHWVVDVSRLQSTGPQQLRQLGVASCETQYYCWLRLLTKRIEEILGALRR
jgi:hypothetical protein